MYSVFCPVFRSFVDYVCISSDSCCLQANIFAPYIIISISLLFIDTTVMTVNKR